MTRKRFAELFVTLTIMIGAYTNSASAEAPSLQLMPLPAHVQQSPGAFLIDSSFAIELQGFKEARVQQAQQRFLIKLSRVTGMPVHLYAAQRDNKPKFFIHTGQASKPIQQLGEDESYHLQVTPQEVRLDAPNPLGILHGLQTFVQLVQPGPDGFSVPAVTIDDHPRFPWRGLMIDVSRHFIPIDAIKRNLDAMEAVKLNVFHWHLSDDQGFRVESKKYPLLYQKGSDGSYYTQDEVKDVIAYAQQRGIRVVPEFDMPGHATSWFVGYPDLASAPGPYQIERKWGIFEPTMDPTRDSTYKFLDGLIGEMSALFPDAYFHIGGDEVAPKQWDSNPKIQEFKRAHNLKSNEELQSYFSGKVQKIVSKHSKIVEGWDEILQPGVPKDIVIQSWRGQDSLAQAARGGYRGILSFGYYLDHMSPASYHYSVDPMAKDAANLSEDERSRILGGEACMWMEYANSENIDDRIWPRTAAIAERLWSPQDVTDVASMYARLESVSLKLAPFTLRHLNAPPQMFSRIAGASGSQPFQTLADALIPAMIDVRGDLGTYNQLTPLNRMVDSIPVESIAARHFSDMVDLIIARTASPDDIREVQHRLTEWRDNDAQLQPMLSKSSLTSELSLSSQNLAKLANAGLQALDYLQRGTPTPSGWQDQALVTIAEASKPQAEMINAIAPALQRLVQAVRP